MEIPSSRRRKPPQEAEPARRSNGPSATYRRHTGDIMGAMPQAGAASLPGARLTAQEQLADLRVGEELAAGAGEGKLAGDQDVAEIGELQPLFRVLLHHDDGLALVALQIAQDLEHHVDEARLEADRGLVDQ